MTTTEPTTRPASTLADDLIALADRVTAPDIDELLGRLEELRHAVEPLAERCCEVLRNYNQESTRLLLALRAKDADHPDRSDQAGPFTGSLEAAVEEFLGQVSGRYRLYDRLHDLSELLDPEDMLRGALAEVVEG